MTARHDAVVLGAGLAGLSAATQLAERGLRVLVVEARPAAGGRATAFTDSHTGDRVDNGQHALFGCYHEALRFLRRAGSSALAVAVCAALARWTGRPDDPEPLLQIAANIEAQTIRVPTGLQDYRPAMYGGICALELGVAGVRRVPLGVETRDLEQRLVLCYTGEPRDSGTNNWDIMKRHLDGDSYIHGCFERIRDTASVMRDALERGDWAAVGGAIAEEWENRMRLAPGVTTPMINDLVARSREAGALAAKVCGAGGGGCLFCFTDPARRGAVEDALRAGGARLLPFTIEARGLLHG